MTPYNNNTNSNSNSNSTINNNNVFKNMIAPNGSTFSMDTSGNSVGVGVGGIGGNSMNGRNGLLPFNKIDPLGRLRMTAGMGQYPISCMHPNLTSGPSPLLFHHHHQGGGVHHPHTSSSFGGVQQSLSMLCDVAMGGGAGAGAGNGGIIGGDPYNHHQQQLQLQGTKRMAAMDDLRKQQQQQQESALKRRKIVDVPPMQNPKLLERLSSLGGGFPMPKWSGSMNNNNNNANKNKVKKQDQAAAATAQQEDQPSLELKPSIGAFPMPGLKDQKQNFAPSFSTYKNFWDGSCANTTTKDEELRKEIFSRRLCKATTTRVVNGRLRHDL